MDNSRNYILDRSTAEKKMRRMALEIIENNGEESNIILAGIRENGSVVARCIQRMLAEISSIHTELITVSIDKKSPQAAAVSGDLNYDNKVIIVIDDVADSGRTLLYALRPFLAHYPKKIQALVLVERSHNSFPVHPDYVGISLATTLQERIYVEVEGDKVSGAYLQ